MLHYHPPKAQVWGHQVGRLSATTLVDRSLRFLNDRCAVIGSQPSDLVILWNAALHPAVRDVVADIDEALGPATAVNKLRDASGQVFRQHHWPFPADKLPAVARWFGELADSMRTKQVVARASTIWSFAWSDEPPPLRHLETPGGLFGVHLFPPHRITTSFSFRDMDHYVRIKAYLAELGLVQLSDRHLRPKIGGGATKQRRK